MADIQQQSKYSNLPWVEMVLLAEAEQDKFSNVRFITLKSYYQDIVNQMVIDDMRCDSTIETKFFKCIEDKAKPLMNSGTIKVKEFVEIDNDLNVTICINIDSITDDNITDALNLLADISVEPNTTIQFGDEVTFHSTEIPSLTNTRI